MVNERLTNQLFGVEDPLARGGSHKPYNPRLRLKYLLNMEMVVPEARIALNFLTGQVLPEGVFAETVWDIERQESEAVLEKRRLIEKDVRSEDLEEVYRRSRIWINLDHLINKMNRVKVDGREQWVDFVGHVQKALEFNPNFSLIYKQRSEDFKPAFTEQIRVQIRAWDANREKTGNKLEQEMCEDQIWTDPEYLGRMIGKQAGFIRSKKIPLTDEAGLGKLRQAGVWMPWGLKDVIIQVGERVERELKKEIIGKRLSPLGRIRRREDMVDIQKYLEFASFYYILARRHRKELVGFTASSEEEKQRRISAVLKNEETVEFLLHLPGVLTFLEVRNR